MTVLYAPYDYLMYAFAVLYMPRPSFLLWRRQGQEGSGDTACKAPRLIKSSFSISLVCATSHRIPAIASTNQGPEKRWFDGAGKGKKVAETRPAKRLDRSNRLFQSRWSVPQVTGFRQSPVQIKDLKKAIWSRRQGQEGRGDTACKAPRRAIG